MTIIQTEEHEVITSCDDINDFQGEERLLLLIMDEYNELNIIGCKTIYDIAYYAIKNGIIGRDNIDPEEWMLIKAYILDPEDLPYDIENGTCVFVIHEDGILFKGESMQEAVDHIEGFFQMDWTASIEDFAVVSALELGSKIKYRIKELIIEKMDGDLLIYEDLSGGRQE